MYDFLELRTFQRASNRMVVRRDDIARVRPIPSDAGDTCSVTVYGLSNGADSPADRHSVATFPVNESYESLLARLGNVDRAGGLA